MTARAERDERGATFVVTAVFLSVAMAMVALVIDVGNVGQERRQAQAAADAAVLAGANEIVAGTTTVSTIVAKVKDYVAKNYGTVTWSGCADAQALAVKPDAGNGCISWDANPPNTGLIRVAVPSRALATFFGKAAAGVPSLSVRAYATASIAGSPGVTCGLCVLGPTRPDLQNGNIEMTGGAVDLGAGLSCSGGSITTFGAPQPPIRIRAGGTASCTGATFSPSPDWNGPVVPDPLAYLPAKPDYTALAVKPNCTSGVATPGIYATIGSCTLSAGLYVVTGSIGGSALLGTAGVTIFLACGVPSAVRACSSTGEAGGAFSVSGSDTVDLRAAACVTATCTGGAWPGIVLWADRNNTATIKFNGSGVVTIVGTMYAPGVTINFKGTPAGASGVCATTNQSFCSRIIIKTIVFSGQGKLQVKYVPVLNTAVAKSAHLSA